MDKQWPDEPPNNYLRLPGLFRRWEIEQILYTGNDFQIQRAGSTSDGTELYAVYKHEQKQEKENE